MPINNTPSIMRVKKIDFADTHNNLSCRLGMLGFSAKLIARETKMSEGMVRYRLKRTGIRLRDYRNGDTKIATYVIERTTDITRKELTERVRKLLK